MHARAFLRTVLAQYVAIAPAHIRIRNKTAGKPVLDGDKPLAFSIAHTKNIAAVAVCGHADVGIDVEMGDRQLRDAHRVARRWFTESEYDNMLQLCRGDDDRLRQLVLETWTRKEAFVKCTGEGIARNMQSFEVSVDDNARILSVDGCVSAAQHWSLKSLSTCIQDVRLYTSVVIAAPIIETVHMVERDV